jgi:ribonuclease BN (tRNA processing enzyme)
MRITFLGSGGAFTDHRVNYQNNAVVETDEGLVLIDCGHTAVQSLKELGVAAGDVRAVLFTHLHGDHASPEQLIWERFYGGAAGPRFLQTEMFAPADLLDPLARSLEPFVGMYSDRDGVVRDTGVADLLQLRRGARATIGGLSVEWFRVPHVEGAGLSKPAYGLALDDGHTRVLWSGDTTFSPRWLHEAAEDERVAKIFHECMFARPFHGTVHTHFDELRTLPEALQQRVTLMHHTAVPDGVSLGAIAGAADRHEVFELSSGAAG